MMRSDQSARWASDASPRPRRCRRRRAAAAAAAAGATPVDCPRAALYIVPTLPAIKSAAAFQAVTAAYVAAVQGLAAPGAPPCTSVGSRSCLPQSCAAPTACHLATPALPLPAPIAQAPSLL